MTLVFATATRAMQAITGSVPHGILLCFMIFYPLQGFMNFLVYMRPRWTTAISQWHSNRQRERTAADSTTTSGRPSSSSKLRTSLWGLRSSSSRWSFSRGGSGRPSDRSWKGSSHNIIIHDEDEQQQANDKSQPSQPWEEPNMEGQTQKSMQLSQPFELEDIQEDEFAEPTKNTRTSLWGLRSSSRTPSGAVDIEEGYAEKSQHVPLELELVVAEEHENEQ
eukprot:Sro1315_g262100.1 n/a (221) ;mRNA; r:29661-30323